MPDVFDWLELEDRPYVERGLHGVGKCAGDAGVLVPPVRESCPRRAILAGGGFAGALDPFSRLAVVGVRVPVIHMQRPVVFVGMPPYSGDGRLVDISGVLVVPHGERRFG